MKSDKHPIPDLGRKGLRDFALVTSGIIVALFGLLLPWTFDLTWPTWPWLIAAVLAASGIVSPMALQPVYKVWMRVGLILSRITTPIILSLVFFLVITPTALIRRLFFRDSIAKTFDDRESYRIKSHKAPTKNLEKPY
jgi:Kef-type K+ transport system membrane component KefB